MWKPSHLLLILVTLVLSAVALIPDAGPNCMELNPQQFAELDRSVPFLVEYYSRYCGALYATTSYPQPRSCCGEENPPFMCQVTA